MDGISGNIDLDPHFRLKSTVDVLPKDSLIASNNDYLVAISPATSSSDYEFPVLSVYEMVDLILTKSNENELVEPVAYWKLESLGYEVVRSVEISSDSRSILLVGDYHLTLIQCSLKTEKNPISLNSLELSNTFKIVKSKIHPEGRSIVSLLENGVLTQFDFSDINQANKLEEPSIYIELYGNETLHSRNGFSAIEFIPFVDFCFGGNNVNPFDSFCCYCITSDGQLFISQPIIPDDFVVYHKDLSNWYQTFQDYKLKLNNNSQETSIPNDIFMYYLNELETIISSGQELKSYTINRPSNYFGILSIITSFYCLNESISSSILKFYIPNTENEINSFLFLNDDGYVYMSKTNVDLHKNKDDLDVPLIKSHALSRNMRDDIKYSWILSTISDTIYIASGQFLYELNLKDILYNNLCKNLNIVMIDMEDSNIDQINLIETNYLPSLLLMNSNSGEIYYKSHSSIAAYSNSNDNLKLKNRYQIPYINKISIPKSIISYKSIKSNQFKNHDLDNITDEGFEAFGEIVNIVIDKVQELIAFGYTILNKKIQHVEHISSLIHFQNEILPKLVKILKENDYDYENKQVIKKSILNVKERIVKLNEIRFKTANMAPALNESELKLKKQLESCLNKVEELEYNSLMIQEKYEIGRNLKIKLDENSFFFASNTIARQKEALEFQTVRIKNCNNSLKLLLRKLDSIDPKNE